MTNVKKQIMATPLNIALNETCHVRSHINLVLKVFSVTSDTHFCYYQLSVSLSTSLLLASVLVP